MSWGVWKMHVSCSDRSDRESEGSRTLNLDDPPLAFAFGVHGFWPFGIWEYESLILWCRPVPAFSLPLCCLPIQSRTMQLAHWVWADFILGNSWLGNVFCNCLLYDCYHHLVNVCETCKAPPTTTMQDNREYFVYHAKMLQACNCMIWYTQFKTHTGPSCPSCPSRTDAQEGYPGTFSLLFNMDQSDISTTSHRTL